MMTISSTAATMPGSAVMAAAMFDSGATGTRVSRSVAARSVSTRYSTAPASRACPAGGGRWMAWMISSSSPGLSAAV